MSQIWKCRVTMNGLMMISTNNNIHSTTWCLCYWIQTMIVMMRSGMMTTQSGIMAVRLFMHMDTWQVNNNAIIIIILHTDLISFITDGTLTQSALGTPIAHQTQSPLSSPISRQTLSPLNSPISPHTPSPPIPPTINRLSNNPGEHLCNYTQRCNLKDPCK